MNDVMYQIDKTIQKLERYAEYLENLVKEKREKDVLQDEK
jgi:hypothetical protein